MWNLKLYTIATGEKIFKGFIDQKSKNVQNLLLSKTIIISVAMY